MSNQIGIIDEPVSPGNDDKLDIKRHSKALTFLEKTNTHNNRYSEWEAERHHF